MMRFIPCLLAAAIAARVTPAAAQAPQASYTPADVRFMSGMIYHHAQAVLIAGWAPSHDAGPARGRAASRSPAHDDAGHGFGAHDARDALGPAARRAGCGARAGVRSLVPEPDDPAPPGRDHDGESAVRRERR